MKRSEQGFTLLETVIALFVTVLSFLLLSVGYRHFSFHQQMLQHEKQSEFHLFLFQWQQDLMGAEVLSHTATSLKVKDPTSNQEILYEKAAQVFRRRVSSSGHQPLLTGIREMKIERTQKTLKLGVHFMNGEYHAAEIILPENHPNSQTEDL